MPEMNTKWIWTPDWASSDREEVRMVYFRKKIWIGSRIARADIRITADARYKLYVNGIFVELGPMKGDNQIRYIDTVNLKPFLRTGENVIAVKVLAYPTIHNMGNHSVFRTDNPGLYIKGYIEDENGWRYPVSADEEWRCWKDCCFQVVREDPRFAPLMHFEDTSGNAITHGWRTSGFDDSFWKHARMYETHEVPDILREEKLSERTIPYMKREKRFFRHVKSVSQGGPGKKEWDTFLAGKSTLEIPAGTEEIVEISAGVEETGFIRLTMSGGKDTKVEFTYAECYVQPQMVGNNLPLKTDRSDAKHGLLIGYSDHYTVHGAGTPELVEAFSPFWFRTFRYIKLRICTKSEPIRLHYLRFEANGYPLTVKTRVQTSDPTHEKIWEISERTLRLCMHETYEDCPYYEQLQYAQDSRLQILYTYAISADDRLARQCMDDFKRSQFYNGLLNCSYPNYETNVIPAFSIHYIFMLYDHMMYFGDRKLIQSHASTVYRILEYFDNMLTPEGYVKKIGGVNLEQPNWSFVDWTPEWNETEGVPPCTRKGPITMESLMYIMGLQYASKLMNYIGWHEISENFLIRAESVKNAVREYCMGENGMLQDGPGIETYSQHCQVFGILTGILVGDQAKAILEETIIHKNSYAQCTVSMSYYLFRAMEAMGLYHYSDHYWNVWRKMIANNCTTCTESEAYGRSECHGWGALILYELPSTVLGVRPTAPGYEKMEVRPVPGYLNSAEGTVHTPKGDVYVKWEMTDETHGHGISIMNGVEASFEIHR